MPNNFDVQKDAEGNYVLVHPSGATQSMAPSVADSLGVRGLFDSRIAPLEQTPVPVQASPEDPDRIWKSGANALAKGVDFVTSGIPGLGRLSSSDPSGVPNAPLQQAQEPLAVPTSAKYIPVNAPGEIAPQIGIQPPQQPQVPMQLDQSQTVSTQQGKVLPLENKDALAAATQAQMRAEQSKANTEAQKADALAQEFVTTKEASQKADAEIAQKEDQRRVQLDQDIKKYSDVLAEIKNTPTQSYWEKQGTSGKIMGGIAMALGALGSAYTKGPNYALEMINKAIDDDLNQQKLDLSKKTESAQGQLNLVAQMRAKFGDERQADAAAKRAMLDNAELQMKSVATRFQGAEAQNNAKTAIAGLQQRKAEVDSQYALAAQDSRTIQSTTSARIDSTKGPGAAGGTADQFKAASFAVRVKDAMQDMAALEGKGYKAQSMSASFDKVLPNFAQGENTQRQLQAQRNFVNALLRRESGAAISESEFGSAEKQYFPQPGDSKATLEQKSRNRQSAFTSLKAEAGNTFAQVKGPESISEVLAKIGAKKN